jgi:hypothetical protein
MGTLGFLPWNAVAFLTIRSLLYAASAGFASAPPCFLALCGNSGCCKTTTLELVCAEEKVEIVTWSEDQWEPQASSLEHSWMGTNDRSNGGSNTDYANRWDGNGNGDRHSREGRESLYGMAVGKGYSSTARDLFKLDGVTPGVYGATKVQYVCDLARA